MVLNRIVLDYTLFYDTKLRKVNFIGIKVDLSPPLIFILSLYMYICKYTCMYTCVYLRSFPCKVLEMECHRKEYNVITIKLIPNVNTFIPLCILPLYTV